MFPNVRGAMAFAAESQVVVTATTVAIGVPELEADGNCKNRRAAFRGVVSLHRW